ncbi:TPA: hypothetical protein ACXEV6_002843 [Serratia marcescens]|uniref:hypothetical protein n=1 Tax=Serratia marcescens TaxID=615 RepID=UPI0036FC220F
MDKSEIAYNAEKFRPKAVVTSDECYGWCGAGAMMIAAAAEIQALGYMPSQHMWVSCVDIDVVAMSMAYIQLYSLGIPGEVVLGNALADERRLVMCTPMHWLEQWPLRLQTLREFKAIS